MTLSVAHRDAATSTLIVILGAWALSAGPARIRFYMAWTLITLLPSSGFVAGLSSRYLYLSAVGFAALMAELLCWARQPLERRRTPILFIWWLVVAGLVVRSAAFAGKNVRTWEHASAPYVAYTATVREMYPRVRQGATLEVRGPQTRSRRTTCPHYYAGR